MTEQDVTPPAPRDLSERLLGVRKRLYARFGHGALSKAADELGVSQERVSNLLSESARDLVDRLEALGD